MVNNVFLGLRSFETHMTDESWQLQLGMEAAGWSLCGKGLKHHTSDVPIIIDEEKPQSVIISDQREWDPDNPCCLDKGEAFQRLEALSTVPNRYTVLKDCQHHVTPFYEYMESVNAPLDFITYYSDDIVRALCPYASTRRLYRTYHSIASDAIPPFEWMRASPAWPKKVLLSGAVVPYYYPLRWRLSTERHKVRDMDVLDHPGYGMAGSHTNRYLSILSGYKVAIATASIYQYALRKIIEASACGCVVITNLAASQRLPAIDDNLVRVSDDISFKDLNDVLADAVSQWDADRQFAIAEDAKSYYDYKATTKRLSDDLRAGWTD